MLMLRTDDDLLHHHRRLNHPYLQSPPTCQYMTSGILPDRTYLERVRARLHLEHHRHLDNAVRHPAVSPIPRIRQVPGRSGGHIVARLRLPVVDLQRNRKRAVVAQAVERRRDERGDGDVPALLVRVEQVEVVLAARTAGPR